MRHDPLAGFVTSLKTSEKENHTLLVKVRHSVQLLAYPGSQKSRLQTRKVDTDIVSRLLLSFPDQIEYLKPPVSLSNNVKSALER